MRKVFYLLAIFVCGAGFISCRTRYVSFNVMRPADINIPSNVRTLVLVDRTEFDRQGWNIVEGIVTGEMPGEDRAAAQFALARFGEILNNSPRFQTKIAGTVLKGNSLTAAFPPPLPWNTVENLCAQYGADALVAIELFDSDFFVTNGSRMVKRTVTENGEKKEIEVPEFWAEGVANLKIGFKIYDVRNRNIIDQQLFNRTNTWRTTGNSIQEALAKLILRTEATRHLAGLAGEAYSYKIAPLPIRVSREFYHRSRRTYQIPVGARKADVNDWGGAISTWQNGLPAQNRKDGGRLCQNIAVGFEVMGDLESAKQWAQKAYIEFGHRPSRNYVQILENRITEQQRLRQQMGE